MPDPTGVDHKLYKLYAYEFSEISPEKDFRIYAHAEDLFSKPDIYVFKTKERPTAMQIEKLD